jgi:hypothetical protein
VLYGHLVTNALLIVKAVREEIKKRRKQTRERRGERIKYTYRYSP